ncbi:uncharacterized protein TRAVEDRAFT_49821 [Trametes versicolor FP-101664 SS1]|uniref:uncharacterized protein n=1 Tax=Trametes versicolor (strain FP-101664) TaxID=717944 RepID=UPI00046235C8|nr:uncharacterized protein TRAVEDRAFT_49821 [Trametes versicolor FP-101664 SS1]EIW57012.1 hypothetical protein TRAVEDRAFT_49821 [Trametes versicolor FP-101664 SS1]
MSSSDSSSIAEVVFISQSVRTNYTIDMLIATLLVYDALLCVDMEVRYVWRAPKASRKLSRLLYIYNRYMSILWNLLSLGTIGAISDTVHILGTPETVPPSRCTALNWLDIILNNLTMLGPAAFTTLRVYALSGRNKMLTGAVLLLSMGPFLVNMSTVYQLVPSNLPPPILVALNIADMVIVVLLLNQSDVANAFNYVDFFIDPISSILNSRFLLALYETNARLERGGSSVSSFSTLDFGEADPRAAGSPELPEFLHSLASPIHSFPDHDPELFDPEPATVQQDPGHEGEVGTESKLEVGAQAKKPGDVEEATGEVEGPARV